MGSVTEVPVDQASKQLAALERVDYCDAFEVVADPSLPNDPEWWRTHLLGGGPRWAQAAMDARNAVAKRFGLKAGRMTDLPIYTRTETEIVTGLDDSHLDFRIVLRVRRDGEALRIRFVSIVQLHGWRGRLYFTPVKPVHRHLVMPGMLRRGARG